MMLCEIIVRQGCAHAGSNLPKLFVIFCPKSQTFEEGKEAKEREV